MEIPLIKHISPFFVVGKGWITFFFFALIFVKFYLFTFTICCLIKELSFLLELAGFIKEFICSLLDNLQRIVLYLRSRSRVLEIAVFMVRFLASVGLNAEVGACEHFHAFLHCCADVSDHICWTWTEVKIDANGNWKLDFCFWIPVLK